MNPRVRKEKHCWVKIFGSSACSQILNVACLRASLFMQVFQKEYHPPGFFFRKVTAREIVVSCY